MDVTSGLCDKDDLRSPDAGSGIEVGRRLADVRFTPDCVAKLWLRQPLNRDSVE
jgi:hypothetical protein